MYKKKLVGSVSVFLREVKKSHETGTEHLGPTATEANTRGALGNVVDESERLCSDIESLRVLVSKMCVSCVVADLGRPAKKFGKQLGSAGRRYKGVDS